MKFEVSSSSSSWCAFESSARARPSFPSVPFVPSVPLLCLCSSSLPLVSSFTSPVRLSPSPLSFVSPFRLFGPFAPLRSVLHRDVHCGHVRPA